MATTEPQARTAGKPPDTTPTPPAAVTDGDRPAPPYRSDIDGLRAIAVGGVLLFHAQVPGFQGGFVGVDVFFVISGYLITQVLTGSREQGLARQLGDFYLRRARRILPALLAMLLVVTLVAIAVLLPRDLRTFGRYLAAAAALLANVAAWRGVEYFSTSAPHLTLTHLWSIAVEEQFYIAYPLLLLACSRYWPRQRLRVLLAAAAISLAFCVWAATHRPAANFYLPPSRGWELLLGAIVALWRARPPLSTALRGGLTAASLAVIAAAFYAYRPAPDYPGLLALPPCLATATLIAVGEEPGHLGRRWLGWRPLAFTGLISYSLYLWHAPLFSLYRYYSITGPGAPMIGVLLAVTFAVAALSWKWIEQPIRRRRRLRSGRSFLWTAATASTAAAACGGVLWLSDGFPQRFAPPVQALALAETDVHPDARRCATLTAALVEARALCRFGSQAPEAAPVLVWGDSHAMALLPAYEQIAQSRGLGLYFAARQSCRPLTGVAPAHMLPRVQAPCADFNAAVLRFAARLQPRVIVLNAYWTNPDLQFVADPGAGASGEQPSLALGLAQTLDRLGASNARICVVLDPPSLQYPAPYALAIARRRGIDAGFLSVSRAAALEQYRDAEGVIRGLQARRPLRIVDPKEVLCATAECKVTLADVPLYFDRNHLSATGARYVSAVIDGCFRDAR